MPTASNRFCCLTGLLIALLQPACSWCAPPLADVHVHYKWNQNEVTSPRQVVQTLRDNDVALAIVIGTPNKYALQLAELAPELVVPVWNPYRTPADWSTWARDRDVIARARQDLASGRYHGIGELHLIGGFAPRWDTPVIAGLASLAEAHDIPLLIHTETSSPDYMKGLCQHYPETRVLWAHAGALLQPAEVSEVLADCPNVWMELSARDPWRFVNNPITDDSRRLLPAWRQLIETYPNRVMIGSDPVWPVDVLDRWDEPDSGWEQYQRFIGFHRDWIQPLPTGLAQKILLGNARGFFKR